MLDAAGDVPAGTEGEHDTEGHERCFRADAPLPYRTRDEDALTPGPATLASREALLRDSKTRHECSEAVFYWPA